MQIDQIFQLVDEFDDDESDPVSMTVDEGWIHLLSSVGMAVMSGMLGGNLRFWP